MTRRRCSALCLALVAAGCGGKDSTPPNNTGVVQISTFIANPQSVECHFTATNPPQNTGYPDSVALQVTVVNTTHSDVLLTAAGSSGVVIRATAAGDVGATPLTYTALPYTPQGAPIRALDGQVAFTLMLPVIPFCQSKPVGYLGYQDVNVSARVQTTTGEYITTPKLIHVVWV